MGCLWPKYKMFELKKYGGVKFDGTEYLNIDAKCEEKLTWAFKNDLKNLRDFHQSS